MNQIKYGVKGALDWDPLDIGLDKSIFNVAFVPEARLKVKIRGYGHPNPLRTRNSTTEPCSSERPMGQRSSTFSTFHAAIGMFHWNACHCG